MPWTRNRMGLSISLGAASPDVLRESMSDLHGHGCAVRSQSGDARPRSKQKRRIRSCRWRPGSFEHSSFGARKGSVRISVPLPDDVRGRVGGSCSQCVSATATPGRLTPLDISYPGHVVALRARSRASPYAFLFLSVLLPQHDVLLASMGALGSQTG